MTPMPAHTYTMCALLHRLLMIPIARRQSALKAASALTLVLQTFINKYTNLITVFTRTSTTFTFDYLHLMGLFPSTMRCVSIRASAQSDYGNVIGEWGISKCTTSLPVSMGMLPNAKLSYDIIIRIDV